MDLWPLGDIKYFLMQNFGTSHGMRLALKNLQHLIMQKIKSIQITLLVVMEHGSDVTATDHSTFKISKINVSTCPGKIGN
jgi:fructose/tagatose bisphosphate aldolase